MNTLTAETLYNQLRKVVVGQDSLCRTLANAAFLHHLRYNLAVNTGKILKNPKQNLLVCGPSGSGKTLAIHTLGKLLNLPVIIQDSTQLTGSGWRGESCSSIVARAVDMAKNETDAMFSIVCLDEMDKVFRSRMGHVGDSGFLPLDNLLTFLSGSVIVHSENNRSISLDTSHMLVICLGAFENLDKIIQNRVSSGKRIGFSTDTEHKEEQSSEDLLKLLKDEDFKEYGIPNEFFGRLSLICRTNALNESVFRKILTGSEISPIRQFDDLLYNSYGVNVSVSDAAIEYIAQKATQSTTGARMLARIVTEALQPAIYDIGSDDSITKITLYVDDNGLFTKYVHGERLGMQGHGQGDIYRLQDADFYALDSIPFFCIKGRTEIWQYANQIKSMASKATSGLVLEHILAATNILAAGICLQLLDKKEQNPTMLLLYKMLDTILQKRTITTHPLFHMYVEFMEKAKTYIEDLIQPAKTAKQILVDYANAYQKEREQADQ